MNQIKKKRWAKWERDKVRRGKTGRGEMGINWGQILKRQNGNQRPEKFRALDDNDLEIQTSPYEVSLV